jgi:hypothetical protein
MPKTIVIYEEPSEVVRDVLLGELSLEIEILIKHGDWEINSSNPTNVEIDSSAESFKQILNGLMEEKKLPVKFNIRLR